MTRRDRQRQGEPEGVDGTFPRFTPGTGVWFRAHSHRPRERDGGCWFYSSVPGTDGTVGGRFDLAHPAGSCYWASSEGAAARERLGRLADLLASDAVLHGVTQGLSSAVSQWTSSGRRWPEKLEPRERAPKRSAIHFQCSRSSTVSACAPGAYDLRRSGTICGSGRQSWCPTGHFWGSGGAYAGRNRGSKEARKQKAHAGQRPFPGRLAAGQRTLNPSTVVRSHPRELRVIPSTTNASSDLS